MAIARLGQGEWPRPEAIMARGVKGTGRGGEEAVLRIGSRNYSSWSLRGWLLVRMSGLPFATEVVSPEDPTMRAELLLQSSSIRIPSLRHGGVEVWDTMAIAEYLHETCPEAAMLPRDRVARARCRSVSGEMHAGFHALRSSLPMNLRARTTGFTVWSAARADIERILAIWHDCLSTWGGPWLFGKSRCVADAMYAPVVTRFRTYDVALDPVAEGYAQAILSWPDLAEWIDAAHGEPEARISELEVEAEF
jgi:glutathione S-transferase